jgi:multiple antibiotic resistance protein
MSINLKELFTVTFTLFAVIDIIGTIPVLITLKAKMGGIREARATLISGALMILFLFIGEPFLNLLGLDVRSFAVGGSIVIFILGLEMVLGIEFFKSETEVRAATVVPIAFPLIAGSGTLTTIISLKALYEQSTVLLAILVNLIFVFMVLHSLDFRFNSGPKVFWCSFARHCCKDLCTKCPGVNKIKGMIFLPALL